MKNHTQNVVEKLVPGPFLGNQKWPCLWINSLKLFTVCFYWVICWRLSKYIETKLQATCFYLKLSIKKKRSGTSLPALKLFLKNISLVIGYRLIRFDYLVAFTSWDIGKYVYYNCLLTRSWRHEFWNWFCLSNQAVFSTWPKSHDKNLTTLRTKKAFKMK